MSNPKVSLRNTKKYGMGVFAKANIKKGEVIAVFDGPFYPREFTGWTDDITNHAIQCGKDLWRDSDGIARYINHSCEPNCGIKGLFKVVAMRAIKKGEQITWDYEMTEKNWHWRMHCKCGSDLCRKVIGNFKNMPRAIRKKYAGYISEWLVPKKALNKIL